MSHGWGVRGVSGGGQVSRMMRGGRAGQRQASNTAAYMPLYDGFLNPTHAVQHPSQSRMQCSPSAPSVRQCSTPDHQYGNQQWGHRATQCGWW